MRASEGAASTHTSVTTANTTTNSITTTAAADSSIAGIAKVETLAENKKEKSVDFGQLREYCKNLFEFKMVTIRKFR